MDDGAAELLFTWLADMGCGLRAQPTNGGT